MKHVAQAAGVSVMTVSLALRHAPSIPVATRERVLAAAEKLGYRRNPLVSVLMAGLRGRQRVGRYAATFRVCWRMRRGFRPMRLRSTSSRCGGFAKVRRRARPGMASGWRLSAWAGAG